MKNDYEVRGAITAIFLNRKDGSCLETIISTTDLKKVKEFPNSWCLRWNKNTNSYYAQGHFPTNEKTVQLHRWILDEPKGSVVDHINHDTLNNTRENLRTVTCSQNSQNRRSAASHSKSGIRGVAWHKRYEKWQATVKVNGKKLFLGYFENKYDAEKVVLKALEAN